jgi:AcrR family transcriptional regulator
MPTRLPASRRRRQLLDVALHVFAAGDFHRTSMSEVAEAAGVTKPVLYQHFRSKRDLYLELLRDVGGRLQSAVAEATDVATGPRERVALGFVAYFNFVSENRAGFLFLFAGDSRREEEFAQVAGVVDAHLADFVAGLISVDGLDTERRLLLGYSIVGLAEAAARHWIANGCHGTHEDLAEQLANLVWAGLRSVHA